MAKGSYAHHQKANYAFLHILLNNELPQTLPSDRAMGTQLSEFGYRLEHSQDITSGKLRSHAAGLGTGSAKSSQKLLDIVQQQDIPGVSFSRDIPLLARALAAVRLVDYNKQELYLPLINKIRKPAEKDLLQEFVQQYSKYLVIEGKDNIVMKK